MKFRLKTLQAIVTIACVMLGIALPVAEHRREVREWNLALKVLEKKVEELGGELILHLREQHPEWKKRSVTWVSSFGRQQSDSPASQRFACEFVYWETLPDGSRIPCMSFVVESDVSLAHLHDHVVHIRYVPSPVNKQITSWVDKELTSIGYVHVEHHQLPMPVPSLPAKRKWLPSRELRNKYNVESGNPQAVDARARCRSQ